MNQFSFLSEVATNWTDSWWPAEGDSDALTFNQFLRSMWTEMRHAWEDPRGPRHIQMRLDGLDTDTLSFAEAAAYIFLFFVEDDSEEALAFRHGLEALALSAHALDYSRHLLGSPKPTS